ncbi:MAG: ribosome biogenesis GTPase Der [Fimbriimonadaceae bacterium]|nr:ribosome biogenesis GTPase Der [Fimbriimonadaceae bacterium]
MRRLPTLVIVGRPNVGKSTLFNRLAGRRVAVVEDQPGVTRDRLYAEAEFQGRRYRIVDTGGILFGDDDPLVEQIRVQAEVALAEADAVLFVVDSMEGLNPADWDLAKRMRGFSKPVLLVANKTDNQNLEHVAQEFHALGLGDVFPISSIHGSGFEDLLVHVFQLIPDLGKGDTAPEEELRVAIVGRPNVGKSSLLNAYSGEMRAIVSDIPGTTRDAIDTVIEWKGRHVRLIDTAGIRRRGKVQGSVEYYMVLRAQKAMERAEVALLVVDGVEGLTDGDKRVAKTAHEMGKPLVIAVNKWDMREPPDGNLGRNTPIKKDFKNNIFREMPEINYALVRFTSAKESSGLDGVIKAADQAVAASCFRVSTGVLNRLVQDATFDKPLTRKGRPMKVRYVTQPETKPPTFILFCNDPELMHFSYLRYLENQIRKAFPLEGTPVRLVPRPSREKYEDRD